MMEYDEINKEYFSFYMVVNYSIFHYHLHIIQSSTFAFVYQNTSLSSAYQASWSY